MKYPVDSQLKSQLFLLLKAGKFWCRESTFNSMFHMGWIVDGRAGGYVVGRRHSEGNIYMIQQSEDTFYIPGHLEGGEFLIPYTVLEQNKERIEEINRDKDIEADSISLSLTFGPSLRILNTVGYPFDKLLYIDTRGQFIVNRMSTMKHFRELSDMIQSDNDQLNCDLDALIEKGNEQPENEPGRA